LGPLATGIYVGKGLPLAAEPPAPAGPLPGFAPLPPPGVCAWPQAALRSSAPAAEKRMKLLRESETESPEVTV
jgi:hypothetical protein